MIRDQIILEKNYKAISLKCYACQQNHTTLECPFLHYIPDKSRLIKIYSFSPIQNERMFFNRNPIKSTHALINKNLNKIAQVKFKEFLQENYIEDEELMNESNPSPGLEEDTEKEIYEYDKMKTIKSTEENIESLNDLKCIENEKVDGKISSHTIIKMK